MLERREQLTPKNEKMLEEIVKFLDCVNVLTEEFKYEYYPTPSMAETSKLSLEQTLIDLQLLHDGIVYFIGGEFNPIRFVKQKIENYNNLYKETYKLGVNDRVIYSELCKLYKKLTEIRKGK